MMICPECSGNGYIRIPGVPDPWETSQSAIVNEREINCPTCEGQGDLPDVLPTNYCPACGEPIPDDWGWCEDHRGSAIARPIPGEALKIDQITDEPVLGNL